MAIIRWDPFRDLVTLREKMNRLFEEAYSSRGSEKDLITSTWTPSVDIYETDHELVLTAELPGIEDSDINIEIEDNTLTIKGERKFEKEIKEENYHRIERAYGSFAHSFSLPPNIEQEKISAEHEIGILKITMPKKPETKPKKISVVNTTVKTDKKS